MNYLDLLPWQAVAGGIVIGFAVTMLLLLNGRVAAISGIIVGLFRLQKGGAASISLLTIPIK